MKAMTECTLFQSLKYVVETMKQNRRNGGFLLAPLMEEPMRLNTPEERRGFTERDAGMIQVRRSHSWYGEVSVYRTNNIPDILNEPPINGSFTKVNELHELREFRGCFLKPYVTDDITDAQVVLQIMLLLAERFEEDGYVGRSFYTTAGPADSPDRQVSITLLDRNANSVVQIAANFIGAEWQDPKLAPFRIRGGSLYDSIPAFQSVNESDISALIHGPIRSAAYDSATVFQNKYEDLIGDDYVPVGYAKTATHHVVKMLKKETEKRPVWRFLYHRL